MHESKTPDAFEWITVNREFAISVVMDATPCRITNSDLCGSRDALIPVSAGFAAPVHGIVRC